MDFVCACSPATGKLLVHGKALAHLNTEVELPAVSALFSDISSRRSHRTWEASTLLPSKVRRNENIMLIQGLVSGDC